jgi:maleate cis-trans isomerase
MPAEEQAGGSIGYGDRARIGAIVPSVNTCAEPEFAAIAPAGVAFHVTRLGLSTARQGDVRSMGEAAVAATALLADLDPDYVLFNCTAAAAMAEPGLADRVAEAAGCPAGTTADAIAAALAALDVGRIALISPYPPELAEPEERFFADRGFEVAAHTALDLADVREWPRIEPRRWLRLAVEAQAASDCEAIVVSCTNIRALSALEAIERETGVPAICSNQAAAWAALGGAGIADPVPGFGALLAHPRPAAAARTGSLS